MIPGRVNVSVKAFRGKNNGWIGISNAPMLIVDPAYQARASLNSYNEPRLRRHWRHTGTNAYFGKFTYSNEGEGSVEKSARGQ
ncbi:MAG: hypothetical protein C4321_10740 [Chloroflexota bacterium]